jgi:hypothetical protein
MNVNPIAWAASTLRLFTRIDNDGVNATVPVTEIKELPIGFPNMDIALLAKGTGATLAQVPDGTVVGGDKRGTLATDWQKIRTASTMVASGSASTIGGGQLNTASGGSSVVSGGATNTASGVVSSICGGSTNTASGLYSFVGGGDTNTASSSNSFVGGGASNTASNVRSVVCGGSSNTASASFSSIGGGASNTASGQYSTVAGGDTNSATSTVSFVGGGARGTTRGIIGYNVSPSCDTPISATLGVTQSALLLLARQTTDATATVLASNNSAAATTNQVTLPNNSAYSFSGEVIAGVTGAGNSARWTIDGAIKRGANAASTVMIGTPTVTMTHFDAGAATWLVAVTANTTIGCITVTVTGAAATTIRWVCKINTTEMTY